MNKIKIFATFFLLVGILFAVQAQDDENSKDYFNPLTHGVPSLGIAPDARGSVLGGAATEADVYSQYWNPAKYAFAFSKAGAGLTYTPWLAKLVDDIDLVYLAGYYKLGSSDRQAISASLRYFSIGDIRVTDANSDFLMNIKPYEASVDLGFSLKLTEYFSAGTALRFIYSDLGMSGISGGDDYYPGWAMAGDLSFYYNNYLMIGNSECLLGLGLNASNIGSKISYDKGNSNSFLPTTLRVGGSLLFPMDDYNTMSLNLDANKYMFPTPPDTREMTTAERQAALEEYYNTNPLPGVFKSFHDAPGGAREEFNEISWALGVEYAYDNKFFVRGGYFYEHPNKGNMQYFSVGAGFKLNSIQVDVSYLISTVPSNALDQTLRFSLCFDMDGLRSLVR